MATQISVISPSYCVANPTNLQINTDKGVTYDLNGDVVFYVKKENLLTLHGRRVLYDDKAIPIVTMYKKIKTLHGRCQVFRGDSNDLSELLFSVKRSSMIKSGTIIRLDVFLADNKEEKMCDFRVVIRGGATKSSCTVFAGESPTIVAKMENNGGFKVCVYPNVDYAFIVTLFMIINKMKDYIEEAGSGIKMAANTVFVAATVVPMAAATIPPLFGEENLEDQENLEEEQSLGEEGQDMDAAA